MTSRFLVRRAGPAVPAVPAGWAGHSQGFSRWSVVDESTAAVHTGFGVCSLEPGGWVAAHVQSFEESVHVLEGEAVVSTSEGSFLLRAGDYGLLPVGVPHAWANRGGTVARWADMLAPQPRDLLAVSVSMRTALLVYSGISVKMMVDGDLGANLETMFMVQYEPSGVAGTHDHPFEETYMILEGEVDASFDGERHRLLAGDVAWAGAGCVHGFSNPADRPVRWLETQAPQPPARHSYRFTRDWDYLREALGGQRSAQPREGSMTDG